MLLVFITSCSNDFLDKQPHEFTDAVFWKTGAQAESALAGAYAPLQDEEALGGEEWCSIEAFSDNAYMNDNYSDYIAMSEFRALQNNEGDLSHNSYVSYYKTIKRDDLGKEEFDVLKTVFFNGNMYSLNFNYIKFVAKSFL